MDHHDNPQNSINNNIKRDNSNHSSPIPSSSSPSPLTTNIRVNSILRATTIFDVTRTGKVVAYDPTSNLVTLRK